jgi:hypothetical protein
MPRLLPDPAVPVVFDVALWFLERARAADGHLPAQKLQNLIWLACFHYEHANDGRPLAPVAFVANEVTVADPNLYRLLEDGRPRIRSEPVPTAVDAFLAEIWSRYAHSTVERLNAVVQRVLDGGTEATANDEHTRGDATATVERHPRPVATGSAPSATQSPPQMYATLRGRQVAVAPWRPPAAPKKPHHKS